MSVLHRTGKLKSNDGIFSSVMIYIYVIITALITLYPFIYILANSFSDPAEVVKRNVWIIPVKPTLTGYTELVRESSFFVSYKNTIWYTVVGTVLNTFFTAIAAYALSLRHFCLRKPVMLFITITMFVSGGIIPTYIIVSKTGLYDSRWSLIIPTLINAYNLIIARTYMETLPNELMESAKIDGANDLQIFYRIVVPVSKPILSVLIIYYAVQHWNDYFNALIYIRRPELKPVQLYLRDLLIVSLDSGAGKAGTGSAKIMRYEVLKYSSIMITILPVTVIYPFFQKHFVQGVMIGAIK